jgi:DNA-binding response OmpR family regulator
LVRYHLHRAGFDVLIAFTGPSGLTAATESRPDAIVLDIMLPQMSGIEVCKALRNGTQTSTIPILLLPSESQVLNWGSTIISQSLLAPENWF